jgi:hypothetical protein
MAPQGMCCTHACFAVRKLRHTSIHSLCRHHSCMGFGPGHPSPIPPVGLEFAVPRDTGCQLQPGSLLPQCAFAEDRQKDHYLFSFEN